MATLLRAPLSRLLIRQPLYADSQLPVIFREPFIRHGYRPDGKSWSYYLASLFQLHNETLNVWSHLLGLLYCAYRAWDLGWQLDYSGDPLTWAVLGLGLGAVAYTSLSALAHLLHSRSPTAHFLCYQIDYVGICLNMQGAGIASYFLLGTEDFYETFGWTFLLLNALLASSVCAGCSISQLCYRRPLPFRSKLWRLVPATLSGLLSVVPLSFKTHTWWAGNDPGGGDLLVLCYAVVGWTILSAFFFVTYIPERYAPGCFDFIGHSHCIFHVILVYVSHLQYDSMLIAYQRVTPEQRLAMARPTVFSVFGLQLLAVVCCILVLYSTRGIRQDRVKGPDACLEHRDPNANGATVNNRGKDVKVN